MPKRKTNPVTPVDLDIDPAKFQELSDEMEEQWEKVYKPMWEKMMRGVDLRQP
jgi:hypothetical protein